MPSLMALAALVNSVFKNVQAKYRKAWKDALAATISLNNVENGNKHVKRNKKSL